MLEYLNGIDRALFSFVNGQLANPVTDFLMPVITDDMVLRVLYGAAMVILLWRGKARLRWLVLFSALTLAATDQIAAHLLKPLIERVRPCHVLPEVHLLVGCGGGWAMPSAHAANAFGQALLFAVIEPKSRWYVLVFATMVAFSRVFVGVHYPGDILVGASVGAALGFMGAKVFGIFDGRFIKAAR
ncbi:MAG: phosphatase PAP2 family protein [candidate division Zixibacteria bacterium]|nr:phosphatase PAP2 family protein [candidate division Zixibacteria bacterium]MDH3937289.1 phosphatase PAP2 family protein [candidate division Zixibacteria bacterium]MDH4035319.1 phosphatase PAP2 family protein [candidate division Zixibacteria bacterium]